MSLCHTDFEHKFYYLRSDLIATMWVVASVDYCGLGLSTPRSRSRKIVQFLPLVQLPVAQICLAGKQKFLNI